MRRLALLLLLLPLVCVGCVSRQAETDIANSAAAIDAAAQSLPDSPQIKAIRANAQAIATAVGHPLVKP
jgi:uncharacterized protein YcfL